MEDIQVGDPLKDLYNEFNPKLKLANSFDEFKSVMSNPNNRKDFYNEFNSQLKLANSFDEFDSVLGLKKKDLGGAISSPTASQSVSKSFISSLPEQKSIYAPSEKIVSESTTVVAPKEAKLVSEANKRGNQITKEAIENSNDLYLKMQNKFGNKVNKETPYIVQNKKELESDLKSGALQVVKSPKTGKYVLAHNAGIFDSFSNAWDNVLAKQEDDRYVAGLNTEEKIKHYEVKDALNQDKYLEAAPSGFAGSVGRTLGENAEPLIKLSATALAAGKAASALGASADIVSNIQKFASFLTFATDAGYSGYADNTERVYKSLREQNPNGDKVEQMKKAENAGLIGEASGIGMAAGMSGMFSNLKGAAQTINTKPFVSALETMAKHTAKEASVQGSVAALSSIASDLGAKSQGMDLSAGDIASKAFETGASTAKFVTILSTAMGTATGLLKVPGYVKSQAKKLVSEMPREEVTAVYRSAEDKGILPEGTTNKVINSLNEYDKAKEKLPEGLSDEHKGALTGIQEKIDKLEKSKEKLAPQYHARVDDTIKSLKDRAVKILDSKDPMSEEVDNILNVKGSEEIAGPPVTEADLIEQVVPKEVKVTEKEEIAPTEVKVTEEVKNKPIVEFTSEGDLTDDSFASVESNLKNTIKDASEKYNIPLNSLLEHYDISKNGEYVSSKTPILNVGKSTDFNKLIDTFKKAAFELYPNNVEELNKKINENKQGLLDALERGDKDFKVDESLGRVYSAIQDINNSFQNSLKTETSKEVKPAEVKPKEEKIFAQKDLDRAEAKKIHGKVSEMEPPSDAEQIALRYLAEGGKVSQDAINEVSGTTKRASLNTSRRELKTGEAKARDYAGGAESLDDLAHRLWEASGQKISERDIKDALMSEIGNNNTRLDASKAYLERYNPEYQAEQYYNRLAEERQEEFLKEQEELERQLREPLDEQIEGEASEEHINNLIKQYEAEFERENKQLESEGEREVAKEVSGRSLREEAPKEKSVEQAYKDLTRNEKRRIINSKFEELLTNEDFYKKFKIKSKCL